MIWDSNEFTTETNLPTNALHILCAGNFFGGVFSKIQNHSQNKNCKFMVYGCGQ